MSQIITVFIDDEGMTFLVNEKIKLFDGEGITQRASHVEPNNLVFRLLFHTLRTLFGDKGRMSDLTRKWPCLWRVNTSPVGGPILLERYRNRQEAIEAEIEFLNARGITG